MNRCLEQEVQGEYLTAFVRIAFHGLPKRVDLVLNEMRGFLVVNARLRHPKLRCVRAWGVAYHGNIENLERAWLYCAKEAVKKDGVQHSAQDLLGHRAVKDLAIHVSTAGTRSATVTCTKSMVIVGSVSLMIVKLKNIVGQNSVDRTAGTVTLAVCS